MDLVLKAQAPVARDYSKPYMSNGELYERVVDEAKNLGKRRYLEETSAWRCLFDEERTLTLMDIIANTTPHGTVGVDLGAGSGILGLAFLNAGGKFLYSVEELECWATFIQNVGQMLGFSSKLEVHLTDATTFKATTNIDYVIAELVSVGLTAEPLVAAIMNIRQYARGALFIPEGAVSTVTIVHGKRAVSPAVEYDSVHLPTLTKTHVDLVVEVPITDFGQPDYVEINTSLTYPGGTKTGIFDSLCMSKQFYLDLYDKNLSRVRNFINLIFGRTPRVSPGQTVRLNMKYRYGEIIKVVHGTL